VEIAVTSSNNPAELFNIDLVGQMAAGVVKDYCERYGEGPAWAQLAGMLNWGPPVQHAETIRTLAARGWLVFTDEPYSLRAGPRYVQEAADV